MPRTLISIGGTLLISSCMQHPPNIDLPRHIVGFPIGSVEHRYSGSRIGIPDNCSKIVVAEGSGRIGYQSVTIDSQNIVEIRHFGGRNEQKLLVYSAKLAGDDKSTILDALLESEDIGRMRQAYATDVADGAGAFIVLVGNDGEIYHSRMSNYFPPEFKNFWRKVVDIVEGVPQEDWRYAGKSDPFEIYRQYMLE